MTYNPEPRVFPCPGEPGSGVRLEIHKAFTNIGQADLGLRHRALGFIDVEWGL